MKIVIFSIIKKISELDLSPGIQDGAAVPFKFESLGEFKQKESFNDAIDELVVVLDSCPICLKDEFAAVLRPPLAQSVVASPVAIDKHLAEEMVEGDAFIYWPN